MKKNEWKTEILINDNELDPRGSLLLSIIDKNDPDKEFITELSKEIHKYSEILKKKNTELEKMIEKKISKGEGSVESIPFFYNINATHTAINYMKNKLPMWDEIKNSGEIFGGKLSQFLLQTSKKNDNSPVYNNNIDDTKIIEKIPEKGMNEKIPEKGMNEKIPEKGMNEKIAEKSTNEKGMGKTKINDENIGNQTEEQDIKFSEDIEEIIKIIDNSDAELSVDDIGDTQQKKDQMKK